MHDPLSQQAQKTELPSWVTPLCREATLSHKCAHTHTPHHHHHQIIIIIIHLAWFWDIYKVMRQLRGKRSPINVKGMRLSSLNASWLYRHLQKLGFVLFYPIQLGLGGNLELTTPKLGIIAKLISLAISFCFCTSKAKIFNWCSLLQGWTWL